MEHALRQSKEHIAYLKVKWVFCYLSVIVLIRNLKAKSCVSAHPGKKHWMVELAWSMWYTEQ